MTTEKEAIIRNYYKAWSKQDPDAVMGFFSESSTFEDLAFEAKFEGLAQIRSFVDLTYAGVPDFVVTPQTIVAEGSKVAATWIMSGTHLGDMPGLPKTGKPFEVRAISMIQFKGDLIETIVDYWNPIEFQRSVGML